MAITQADRDAAEERIRAKISADGWPEPRTDEEFRYAVLANLAASQGAPAPGLTEEDAMRIAVEETKASHAVHLG
ncbi:hypothetical protein ACT3SZ_10150 [Corynebacterium sp. AOP40-9SA-29]|uniref:hypothetical protein n=1 Tax=Corynebacterium sp. AOP40-9SA-29 TaxID=3457677 RepID=UPI004034BD9E